MSDKKTKDGHTQGKWIVEKSIPLDDFGEELKEEILILNKSERYDIIICIIESSSYSEANAERIVQMHNSFDDVVKALKEIAKGEGRFNRDQLTHANNTIEDMIKLANEAIAKARNSK